MREKCPHCGDLLVSPTGPVKSDILIIGDYPDWFDIQTGKAFSVGYKKDRRYITRAGDILRDQLTKNSVRPERVRMTNVWLHATKKEEDCPMGWHMTKAYEEIAKAKFVLLSGTSAVNLLLPDASAQDWSGLEILSPDLPKEVRAMGAVKMATGFGQLGEVSLVIQKFTDLVREEENE